MSGAARSHNSSRAPGGPLRLRGSEAATGPERCDKSGLKHKLLLIALPALRQAIEQLDAAGEVGDRFQICRALERTFAGAAPILDGLFGEARLGAVMRQQCGLGRYNLGKFGLRGLRRWRVQLPAAARSKVA